MVDVDRFKDLNDRLGHPAGDAALRGLSDALSRAFPRKSDFVARYGGEEFAVVLSEDGEDVGKRLAERLLGLVRGMRIPWEGEEIGISISIGVAMPGEGDEVEDWVGRADRRLYQAKQEGRDRAV
jgi:diguanylate cyclase (GGDEF)-like protein